MDVSAAREVFAEVSSGGGSTCGLRSDGSIECWGWIAGISGSSFIPQPSADERFAAIASGPRRACALRQDGSPFCWGGRNYGATSPPEGETFVSISAGRY